MLGACAAPRDDAAGYRVSIPVVVPGGVARLDTRVCPASGPVRGTVVVNHGSPPSAADRPLMVPIPCGHEAVRWFSRRGFTVVAALRRGFGASDGPVAEFSGPCADPDYVTGAREAARDAAAVVRYAGTLGGARPVVVGQSTGGWATLAFAASAAAGEARAAILFAPGEGGHVAGLTAAPCAPERLVEAAGVFGRTARFPTLWLVSANDSYFGPPLSGAMARAFEAAGGRVAFVALPPFGTEGHSVFTGRGGSLEWGPAVAAFLAPGQPET